MILSKPFQGVLVISKNRLGETSVAVQWFTEISVFQYIKAIIISEKWHTGLFQIRSALQRR